jgi:hypothetical protein
MKLPARLALLGLAVAIPVIQSRIDARLGVFRAQEESIYLWSGTHVRQLVPGFEDLTADLYWLRTVQYFGGHRRQAEGKRFELLHPLVDIATTLDPRFEMAYSYGAIFLAEPWPMGAGEPEKAAALLDRGAKATGSWRLKQLQGYQAFLFLCDASRAAEILTEASEMPGAAFWLKMYAAEMRRKGGERDMARMLWRQMLEDAERGNAAADVIRSNAETNLRRLDAYDSMDLIDRAIRVFQERLGRLPASLAELQGAVGRLPTNDPSGVRFEYDAEKGRVSLSMMSALWRPDAESSLCKKR